MNTMNQRSGNQYLASKTLPMLDKINFSLLLICCEYPFFEFEYHMSTTVLRGNSAPTQPKPMAGPHICSKVGASVSSLLRAAMVQMCEQHGGKLTKDEIVHIFDLVTQSSELFPVYQSAYSNCAGLQKSTPFVNVDEATICRFVLRSYCGDAMTTTFKPQIKARGAKWINAFIDGFMTFLTEEAGQDLPQGLFKAYQKLALSCSEPLTPVTILTFPDVIEILGRTDSNMRRNLEKDHSFLKRLETTTNRSIAKALQLRGPSIENLNIVSATAFISRLSERSEANPFRNAVLDATGTA